MKVMTFNVGIWTRNTKKSDPFYWKPRMEAMTRMIEDQDPDIICFQELWFPATNYIPKTYKKVWGTGLEHPIYAKRSLKAESGMFRIHWSEAEIEGIRIFSIHGHWNERLKKKLCASTRKVYTQDSRPAILCGDWNVYIYDISDLTPELSSARELLNLPEEPTYAHFHIPNKTGEIDLFMLYNIMPEDYTIITDPYECPSGRISDHYPVMIVC